MAKNQRQRRPLQEDKRVDRKTPRERQQQSRRQRDRIEENRDRRELRRERERLRRQTVDSVRSPKEDLRVERTESRLIPVEETFLGHPIGAPKELPIVIGERWTLSAGQAIASSVDEIILWNDPSFTTERNGYPSLYDSSTGEWRIPAGLGGIWEINANTYWAPDADGIRIIYLYVNGAQEFFNVALPNGSAADTLILTTIFKFSENDTFHIQVGHNAGNDLNIQSSNSFMSAMFLGK